MTPEVGDEPGPKVEDTGPPTLALKHPVKLHAPRFPDLRAEASSLTAGAETLDLVELRQPILDGTGTTQRMPCRAHEVGASTRRREFVA